MRLWQGTWSLAGELLIWGGRSDAGLHRQRLAGLAEPAAETTTLSAAGESSARPVEPHPFAVEHEQLQADLSAFEIEPSALRFIQLYLPTDSLGPLPSPHLLGPSGYEPADEPQLVRWEVPALALRPPEAIDLLASLPQRQIEDVRYDQSIRYWVEVAKLLLELLTRGRFVPGISRDERGFRAGWKIAAGEKVDQHRLAVLVSSMPPICRSVSEHDSRKPPDPSALIESFLGANADVLIRLFLRRYPLLPPGGGSPNPRHALFHAFLAALTAENGELGGPEFELARFEQRMNTWSAPLFAPAERHPLQLTFRIGPVERGEDDSAKTIWQLEFLVRSTAEPERITELSRFWAGDLGFLKNSSQTADDLEQWILAELGRASHLFAPLSAALSSAYPAVLELSTIDAYQFLKEGSRLLEQADFGIILPRWWQSAESAFGLSLKVQSGMSRSAVGPGFLGMNDLLDYSWSIAVGSDDMSIDEFKMLAATGQPLVRYRGSWLELSPARVKATMDFIERRSNDPQIRLIEALKIGLGSEADSEAYPVVRLDASGWVRHLLEGGAFRIEPLAQPAGFNGSLRSYQLEGLSWLAFLDQAQIGACLADDMGLGKTIQLIALLLNERNAAVANGGTGSAPRRVRPTLLIVPMSILDNWQREINRFGPSLSLTLHHGASRATAQNFSAMIANCDVLVTTYSLAYRDEALLSSISWGRIVLDEAQNIKNLDAKQTRAVRRLVADQLARSAGDGGCGRVALTGTPLENHLDELWSIFDFLNPGLLGSLQDFRTRFSVPIETYRNKTASSALSRLIRPFLLRRLKSDPSIIEDLPEKIEMDVMLNLTPEQAAVYQTVLEEMLPAVEAATGMHRKGIVLATITKLKMICDHPSLYLKDGQPLAGRSGKLAMLEELLETILETDGDKVLIFSQYAKMGALLQRHLQEKFDTETLFLHGGLSKQARGKIIDRFQRQDGPRIFVLSLKAGGFGLNLTEANQVIHYDQWWNPAVEAQATDRAYRIGQLRNVQVRRLISKGTLEEKIAELLGRKKDLAAEIVGTTRNIITELSSEELIELLRLNP